VVVVIMILPVFDPKSSLRLQPHQYMLMLMRMSNPAISITRNHDGRTCAFAFGEFASGSHADLQLLRFSADNWAIEVRLMQGILEAAPSRTPAVARLEVNAGTALLWRGARLHKRWSLYNT
jgi:hypothetical protein